MNLDTILEVARFALGGGLVLANIAVWYGVWLERDSAPAEVQRKGWRILVGGLAAEVALGLFLFATDTTIGLRQTAEIYSAQGAALTAINAADIANKAATGLQAALRVEASAQQVLRDENRKLQQALDLASGKITSLQQQVGQRHLNDAEKRALIVALKPFHGQKVEIVSILGDTEGKAYAADFVGVFDAANWDHDGLNGILASYFGTTDPVGIMVTVHRVTATQGRSSPGINALIATLQKLNLLGTKAMNDQVSDGSVNVIIGRKPPAKMP